MARRSSATPYAKALFEVALSEHRVDKASAALATFAGLLEAHPDLARVLTHPAVAPREKHRVVDRLLAELEIAGPERKLLLLLADRDQLALAPDVQRAFHSRLLAHRRIIDAQVTTAVPLPPDRQRAVAEGLSRATGQQVHVTPSVDASIMGGVVARLGSIVFDGSVRRQLERVREQLVSGA